jgi:hypothetical protein
MSSTSPIQRNDTDMIDALLVGGPASLGTQLRRLQVPALDDKVKVPYCGGYEHFERSSTDTEATPVVFRWTGRTKIAE